MYIFIVLMLTGVKASGTATLSFIFPASHEKEVVQEVEKISEPLLKVGGVREKEGELEIDLISREAIEFDFDVLYDDGSVESYESSFVDGVKKLKVPIVLSGSRKKIRWVNILWEDDGLVVCNASNEDLPDLSLNFEEEFEKN